MTPAGLQAKELPLKLSTLYDFYNESDEGPRATAGN